MRFTRSIVGVACVLGLLAIPEAAAAEGTTAPISSWNVRSSWDVPINKIAYDAKRDSLLGLVSSNSHIGNHLAEFSQETGLPTGRSLYVGSDPGTIALSDDLSTAYIGFIEASEIVRVDLQDFRVTARFSVGVDPEMGPLFVKDLAVPPGAPDIVVATLYSPFLIQPQGAGTKAFKNGVLLPSWIPDFGPPAEIEFLDSNTLVRVLDLSNSTMTFLKLDSTGISVDASRPSVYGVGASIKAADGIVYGVSKAFDGDSGKLLFRFSSTPVYSLAITPTTGRLVTISATGISTFDSKTGQLIQSSQVPAVGPFRTLVATDTGFAAGGLALLGPDIVAGDSRLPTPISKDYPPYIVPAVRELNVGANDLVYDEGRKRVYASVPATDPGYSNELVVISPESGLVYRRLQLADDPGPMAITADHSRLFVGLNKTGEVKEVDLDSLSVTGSFDATAGQRPMEGWNIEAAPGSADVVAVSGRPNSSIAVFKAGTKLPQEVASGPLEIVFGDATTLYGATKDIQSMHVGPDGIVMTKVLKNVMDLNVYTSERRTIQMNGGLLYTSSGAVIDPQTGDRRAFFGGDGGSPGSSKTTSVSGWVPAVDFFFRINDGGLHRDDPEEQRAWGSSPLNQRPWHKIIGTGNGVAIASRDTVALSGNTPRVGTWGWNGFGQLGGAKLEPDRNIPGMIFPQPIGDVSAGFVHSLALDRSFHTVQAWGSGAVYTNGFVLDRAEPVKIIGLERAASFSAGLLHSLAIDDSGKVQAWGWNGSGQLGTGTLNDSVSAQRVPTGVTRAVAAGGQHSLALKPDGTVLAWGDNTFGQLGDGTTEDSHSPKPVPGLTDVTAVSAGAFHSVAVHADGKVSAWGWNGVGQLGDGTTDDRLVPTKVPGLEGIKQISAGFGHNLAMGVPGEVKVWGWNIFGQLGDGTTVDRHAPVSLAGLTSGVDGFSAGAFHTLAVRDEVAYGWGWNGFGQLGDGTYVDRNTPTLVKGLPRTAVVSAGGFHSIALRVTAPNTQPSPPEPGVWNEAPDPGI